jgi:hypothetical protein
MTWQRGKRSAGLRKGGCGKRKVAGTAEERWHLVVVVMMKGRSHALKAGTQIACVVEEPWGK